jgi:hypothetical protein
MRRLSARSRRREWRRKIASVLSAALAIMVAAAAGANQGAAMAAQRVRSLLMRSDVPVAAVLVASSIAGDPSLVSGMGGLVATHFWEHGLDA